MRVKDKTVLHIILWILLFAAMGYFLWTWKNNPVLFSQWCAFAVSLKQQFTDGISRLYTQMSGAFK